MNMNIRELRKNYFNAPFHTDSFVRNSIKDGLIDDVLSMSPEEFETWSNTFAAYVIKKKNGRVCLKHLREIFGYVPTFQDFTKRNLVKICEELSKRYSPGTAKLETSIVRSALNYYKDDVDLPFSRFAEMLRVKSPKSDAVFLSEEELEMFAQVEPRTKEERYAKRIFIIMSKTGMRISDAREASLANVQSFTTYNDYGEKVTKDFFVYTSIKTTTKSSIPCGELLKEALSDDFKHIDESQIFNAAIRELCRRAWIDDTVTIFRKGKYETKPKYEFVSAHTARRSFVTNLYLRGMDLLTISKLAGHSGIEMTTRYVCAPKPIDEEFMDFFN